MLVSIKGQSFLIHNSQHLASLFERDKLAAALLEALEAGKGLDDAEHDTRRDREMLWSCHSCVQCARLHCRLVLQSCRRVRASELP